MVLSKIRKRVSSRDIGMDMFTETMAYQVEYLERDGLVNLISLAASQQKTGVMTFLASGRWQAVRVVLLKCNEQTIVLDVLSNGQTASQNIRINQPVGLSFRIDFSKYICGSMVVGIDSSVLRGQSGRVLLELPRRIQKIPRRAYQRQPVPKDMNVRVLFWHRGFLEKTGSMPVDCYWQGQLQNISVGGMQLSIGMEKRDCFFIGQLFGIQFTPMCYQKPILAEGQLRHIRENQENYTLSLGIEFLGLEISLEGRVILERLLETVEEYRRLESDSETIGSQADLSESF